MLTATLLIGALVLVACSDDEETETETGTAETATPAATATPTATGSAAEPGSVSGSVTGAEPAVSTSTSDEIYTPVSDVDAHLALALDVRDIAALLKASPVDYTAIGQIYSEGKNSQRSDGTFRTLKGFATDPGRAEQLADAAALYGSPTFLDDEISAVLNGTGIAAGWTDGQREQAVNKGILRILYYWVLDEMGSAKADLAAGEVDPADGAPHAWDEAWAFYVGAADEGGARPYALAATALKREADYKKEGLINEPLRQALADGLEAIEEGDAAALDEAEKRVMSRLNAIFYIATARYFNNAYAAAAKGDTSATAVALVEGLSFYRTIQPIVAVADPEADEIISAFYQRGADGPITVEERDAALAALNERAVTNEMGLQVTDMLTPASYAAAQ
ncbi:MAG: hypothetical protein A2V88_15850 [Elusimicrobia bacterium RBG_16_66_12]|nr:MAG: hypothetical protein A2V88_15850 [Elusimicrobia bacterium RBG_16_66_12]